MAKYGLGRSSHRRHAAKHDERADGVWLGRAQKKNMGSGITNRYYCLTEAGRQYVLPDPDTPSVTTP